MSATTSQKDLLVLVADLDAENAFQGLLTRGESLKIRPLDRSQYDILRHPNRDSGCFGESVEFLRPFIHRYKYLLVAFDLHGSGAENRDPEEIEAKVRDALSKSGWDGRCEVVVLDPELEVWVWSDSPVVDTELGWRGQEPDLREWMTASGIVARPDEKPSDPKNAMYAALRKVRKPRSSRIFHNVACKVSLTRCQDRAFLRLKRALQNWLGER